MARLLLLAVVAVVLYLLLRSVVSAFMAGVGGGGRRPSVARPLRHHLVKDPVCETYIPQHSAIPLTAGSATYYFCSPACAEKFKVRS